MAWLAAAVFGIAVIYFAINNAGFRKVVFYCLAAVVVIGLGIGGYIYWDQQRMAARSAYAKTLISPFNVDFFGMTLASNAGAHVVRGSVRNRSAFPLRSFTMKIIVQDCPNDKCETIGEDSIYEYVSVPPGQVRTFESYVSLIGMPTPTKQQWYSNVLELEARVD